MNRQPYHSLIVWQETHKFVLEIYRVTGQFPIDERFGITSQLRRAAVSVEANVVEGHAKRTRPDCLRFLDMSRGSSKECIVLLEIARDLKYLSPQEFEKIESLHARVDYLLYEDMLGIRQKMNP